MLKFFVSLFRLHPYTHLSDYMHRWWLVKAADDKSTRAVRVHRILRSDHDRALHDHPWENCSIILRGGYWEVVPGAYQAWVERGIDEAPIELRDIDVLIHRRGGGKLGVVPREILNAHGVYWRGPLSKTRRSAEALHRLVVPAGRESWSLFITWPKSREWGFATPQGWVHNVTYLKSLGRDA
jgi:hypothetical protein